MTTSNRRPSRAAADRFTEIHPRGSASAIGAVAVAPPAGRSLRMEMARPVQESNEIPAMLDAIATLAMDEWVWTEWAWTEWAWTSRRGRAGG